MGFQLLVLLVRGPHCARHTWAGWKGGLLPAFRTSVKTSDEEMLSSAPDMPMEKRTAILPEAEMESEAK
jgi:hypothetical protein